MKRSLPLFIASLALVSAFSVVPVYAQTAGGPGGGTGTGAGQSCGTSVCTPPATCNSSCAGTADGQPGTGPSCGTAVCQHGQTCAQACSTGTGTGGAPGTGAGLTNPLNNITDLPSLLTAVLNAVVTLGGIFLTLMLVFVGFKFVAAQGNAEELKSARSMLIWTVIGGLILLGAKSIEVVIQTTVSSL